MQKDRLDITLPSGAYIVLPDEQEEKTKGGIILGEEDKEPPTTGTIVYASQEVVEHLNKRIKFRGSFAEFIELEDKPHLFFRDLNSSIYYFINS